MHIALEKVRAANGTVVARAAPSRRWWCQSSGLAKVSVWSCSAIFVVGGVSVVSLCLGEQGECSGRSAGVGALLAKTALQALFGNFLRARGQPVPQPAVLRAKQKPDLASSKILAFIAHGVRPPRGPRMIRADGEGSKRARQERLRSRRRGRAVSRVHPDAGFQNTRALGAACASAPGGAEHARRRERCVSKHGKS